MDVIDELRNEGREEGREEGRKEGLKEGLKEGRAQMLLEQLAVRFGSVPAKAKSRILAADRPALARWSLQVLTAPTLEAVLEGDTAARATKKPAAPTRRPASRKRASAAR